MIDKYKAMLRSMRNQETLAKKRLKRSVKGRSVHKLKPSYLWNTLLKQFDNTKCNPRVISGLGLRLRVFGCKVVAIGPPIRVQGKIKNPDGTMRVIYRVTDPIGIYKHNEKAETWDRKNEQARARRKKQEIKQKED